MQCYLQLEFGIVLCENNWGNEKEKLIQKHPFMEDILQKADYSGKEDAESYVLSLHVASLQDDSTQSLAETLDNIKKGVEKKDWPKEFREKFKDFPLDKIIEVTGEPCFFTVMQDC